MEGLDDSQGKRTLNLSNRRVGYRKTAVAGRRILRGYKDVEYRFTFNTN